VRAAKATVNGGKIESTIRCGSSMLGVGLRGPWRDDGWGEQHLNLKDGRKGERKRRRRMANNRKEGTGGRFVEKMP